MASFGILSQASFLLISFAFGIGVNFQEEPDLRYKLFKLLNVGTQPLSFLWNISQTLLNFSFVTFLPKIVYVCVLFDKNKAFETP